MIIAIDGPSGAGKSTVSDDVAKKLNFSHLDTGAMYRAIAYDAVVNSVDLDDENKLTLLAKNDIISFEHDDKNPAYKRIFLNDEDITNKIRTSEIDKAVTPVCQKQGVRDALVDQQRNICSKGDYILDGRDIGTVVCPNAELKIFLTASDEERANRRVLQNKLSGTGSTDYDEILNDLKRRDYEDSHRDISPLQAADDAKILNSTNMTQDEVVDTICRWAKEIIDK